jgi:predicted ATP-dependent endonuclease of OLD family
VYFVETDRLSASDPPRSRGHYIEDEFGNIHEQPPNEARLRVEQYSSDIVRLIQSVLAAYAKHSQESDRTFPERLVRFLRSQDKALTEREILAEMADLEDGRQRLISLGFLDKESGLRDLTEDDVNRAREALTIYVRDIREKFKVFDDLALKIGSLTDIINDRYRYKTLNIDRERGFQVVSNTAGPVSLSNLSSGEQHELVLLYELLFKISKNDLVLIDGPEISLHVAWQSRFLKDLLSVLELTDAYAVIATHSPTIIGNRWDLAVQLKGPADQVTDANA